MEELQEAVTSGNINLISVLLCSSQHLVNTPIDDEDTTLIHLAAANGTPQVIQLLLKHGAQVNWKNEDGLTALHVAAMWGNDTVVLLLLENEADPFINDDEDLNPLDHAMNQGHTECVTHLQKSFYSLGEDTAAITHDSLGEDTAAITHDSWGEDTAAITHDSWGEDTAAITHDSWGEDTVAITHDGNMNMSMAETFVDIYELTQVTQLLPEELDSPMTTPTILTTPTTPTTPTNQQPDLLYSDNVEQSILKGPGIPKEIQYLTNKELREKLICLGEHPGPVNDSTRSAYQAYLAKIQAGIQPTGNKGYKGYKYELVMVLNGTIAIPKLDSLEEQIFQSFRASTTSLVSSPSNSSSSSFIPLACQVTPLKHYSPSPSTPPVRKTPHVVTSTPRRKQTKKDHFNYLLLDPLVMDRLEHQLSDLECFQVFVEGIFYVGKGKNSRSMQHLKDAKTATLLTPSKVSGKVNTILDIWSADRGVISLQLFHNTTAEEAFTREACLIEAIGLDMLTNIQRGHVYGEVCGWKMSKRRLLGIHLIYKAFKTYLIFKPQQIFREDI